MKKLLIALMVLVLIAPATAQWNSSTSVLNKIWNHTYFNILMGNATGKTAVYQAAVNSDVAATEEDVTHLNNAYPLIAKGQALKVFSSDAKDDTSGVGLRTITIVGVDSNFAAASETVTLAGTDTVTTTGKFVRIFDVYGATAGSETDAAGNIKIEDNNQDTTLAQITAASNEAQFAMFTVPATKTFYLTHIWASSYADKTTMVYLYSRDLNAVWRKRFAREIYRNGFLYELPFPISFSAKTDVTIRATATGASGHVAAGFMGWYQ
jgi:hypothetical protein